MVHRNLLSGGRGAALESRYATHEREIAARVWWPARLANRSRSELRLRRRVEDENAYRLDLTEAELAVLYEKWRHSTVRVGIELSDANIEDRSVEGVDLEVGEGVQTVFSATWFRDTSLNPISPARGARYRVETAVSVPGVLTDAPFASLRGAVSRYFDLGDDRVLASRVDLGYAWPLGDASQLRPDRRWYAGGVSTMRGYDRRDLGPRDDDGNPLGGQVRLLVGTELRLPIKGPIGMAVFLDSGQVWRERQDVDLGTLALAGGAGAVYNTPIGPLRLDLAYNRTEPDDGQPRWQVQFAIGHPY